MRDGLEIANELAALLDRFMTVHEKLYLARGVCETREPAGGDVLYGMTSLATGIKNDLEAMIEMADTPDIAAALASSADKVEAVIAARR